MARTRTSPASTTPLTQAATIKEVAERAGVSTATVSRVLSGQQAVRQELIDKVREAVRALDYQPNRAARNLRKRSAQIIGVVISDIQNPFFPGVMRGIEKVLEEAGYTLLLSNSDEDPRRELIHLNTLRAEGVAGIILAPARSDAEPLRQFIRSGMPVVAIDRGVTRASVDTVTVNNISGAASAVAHLVELGHTRIAMISGPDVVTTGAERRRGYLRGMELAGLPAPDEYIRDGQFRQEGGYHAMLDLLDLPEPPTGVLAANNLMSLGALQAIHQRGVRIPGEISLVGFDDMPWTSAINPPLTVVAQPTAEIGATAARLLIERIADPARPARHVILETRLIERASTVPGRVEERK